MSNDRDSVLAVARGEKQPSDAMQIIKDPMYLEFLGLHGESNYDCTSGGMSFLSILYFTIAFCNALSL